MNEPLAPIDDLIVRHFSDTLDAAEKAALNRWLKEDKAHLAHFKVLQEICFSACTPDTLSIYDKEKAHVAFAEKASVDEDAHPDERPKTLVWLKVAALVAVVIGLFSYLSYHEGQKRLAAAFAPISIEAPQGSTTKVSLPDGSLVWLNAGSIITYSQGFGVSDRQITLSGEGWFEVKKGLEIPFSVLTKSLSVAVTGTKFNFRDYPDEPKATVDLVEGGVNLQAQPAKNGISCALKPNQQAILDKLSGQLVVENHDARNAGLWTDGTLMFDGKSLKEIAIELGRSYNARINIARRDLEDLHFYGTFARKEQSLREVLDALSKTGRIKYALQNDRATIY